MATLVLMAARGKGGVGLPRLAKVYELHVAGDVVGLLVTGLGGRGQLEADGNRWALRRTGLVRWGLEAVDAEGVVVARFRRVLGERRAGVLELEGGELQLTRSNHTRGMWELADESQMVLTIRRGGRGRLDFEVIGAGPRHLHLLALLVGQAVIAMGRSGAGGAIATAGA
jgi:hypothetical protein